MAEHENALVLGGGGSAGNAWEIGVIAGLFDAGLDVTQADLIVGTSAGSTAAAQITNTAPTELLAAIIAAGVPTLTGPVDNTTGAFPRARSPTTWREQAASSPSPRTRSTCVAAWARRRSSWTRRRTALG